MDFLFVLFMMGVIVGAIILIIEIWFKIDNTLLNIILTVIILALGFLLLLNSYDFLFKKHIQSQNSQCIQENENFSFYIDKETGVNYILTEKTVNGKTSISITLRVNEDGTPYVTKK